MKTIIVLLVLGISNFSWAEYVDDVTSSKEAAEFVISKQCGNAGKFVSEEELDSDYDSATYRLDFTNGWAHVTTSRKEFPVEPYDEYDYFVSEYFCNPKEPGTDLSVSTDSEYLYKYVCRDAFNVTINIDTNGKAFATGYSTDVEDLEFENVEGLTHFEDGFLHFVPSNKKDLDFQMRYDEIVTHFEDYCTIENIIP